jgi:hypothetical protein
MDWQPRNRGLITADVREVPLLQIAQTDSEPMFSDYLAGFLGAKKSQGDGDPSLLSAEF